jgi:hypothetical protein
MFSHPKYLLILAILALWLTQAVSFTPYEVPTGWANILSDWRYFVGGAGSFIAIYLLALAIKRS